MLWLNPARRLLPLRSLDHRPLQQVRHLVLRAPLAYMSSAPTSPHRPDPRSKRRKTGPSSPTRILPYATAVPSSNMQPAQLELTEVESNLRRLLLDVAAYIDSSPPSKQSTGVQIPADLEKEKVTLRWTGGWVRDKLLHGQSHDIDLAINKMTGEHFGLKMQEYLSIPGNAEKYGLFNTADSSSAASKTKHTCPGLHKIEANPEKSKNLETATTKIMGIDLDLVNLRKETYNEVSRNPQMEFGTAEEDAMRRDATVNAMFYNLHTCQVEDLTKQGHKDMAAGIIRTPLEPYQTFKDDPLRILRLIRFASRLNYTIDPETAKAMGNTEIQHALKLKISRERVGIELEKMLKGPRPRMALELINRFGLYRTVFTDPTRDLLSDPEVAYFEPAYDFIHLLIAKSEEIPSTILETLVQNEEEKHLAWICTTLMPWADAPMVPHPKPSQRPFFTAYLVAREGFKAPNKVCDIIAAALSNSDDIQNHVAQCAKGLRRPDAVDTTNNFTARDTLGMAIRRWGPAWRVQLLFTMLYETVLNRMPRKDLLASYAAFIDRILELNLQDAAAFKPLLKGTDLAKALNAKPGPWMKDALDVVMAWQLRNPDVTDPAEAIEAVKASRSMKNESELPSRLASHFLQLTIPPLFSQHKKNLQTLEKARQRTPWRDPGHGYALDLLRWSIGVLSQKDIEAQWRFLMPPILQIMDSLEVEWKAKGCHLLAQLLEEMKLVMPSRSADFLQRSGYHSLLTDALLPLFTYLPSLTPEDDSITLLSPVYPALLSLADLLPSEPRKTAFLSTLVRQAILRPLAHFSNPCIYPSLSSLILSHLPRLLHALRLNAVQHLAALLPLLSALLQDPFALAHPGMVLATLAALRSVLANAWPRVAGHRGPLLLGLCVLWSRCLEARQQQAGGGGGGGGDTRNREREEVEAQVRETGAMLDAVLRASGEAEVWEAEKRELGGVEEAYGEIFGLS